MCLHLKGVLGGCWQGAPLETYCWWSCPAPGLPGRTFPLLQHPPPPPTPFILHPTPLTAPAPLCAGLCRGGLRGGAPLRLPAAAQGHLGQLPAPGADGAHGRQWCRVSNGFLEGRVGWEGGWAGGQWSGGHAAPAWHLSLLDVLGRSVLQLHAGPQPTCTTSDPAATSTPTNTPNPHFPPRTHMPPSNPHTRHPHPHPGAAARPR